LTAYDMPESLQTHLSRKKDVFTLSQVRLRLDKW
jgi:hypothetical protein